MTADDSIQMASGEEIDLAGDCVLQAPIPRPSGTIMCIGKNYLDHVKEVDTWKDTPGITQPEAPKVNSTYLYTVALFLSYIKPGMYLAPAI